MAYPKSAFHETIDCLKEGNSIRDAARKLGMSASRVTNWKKKAAGASSSQRAHPIRYSPETVRMTPLLAYGDHGLRLDEQRS